MRRLNFTGRRRIEGSKVLVRLHDPEEASLEFSVDLDLSTPGGREPLPPEARVFIEAYHRTLLERFDLGTVARLSRRRRHRLTTLKAGQTILFRLKVVDDQEVPGRILALAKGIRPLREKEKTDTGTSLLPVTVDTLDGIVYRLDYLEDLGPALVLNQALDEQFTDGIKSIAQGHPFFVSIVYPAVVTDILRKILLAGDADWDDEEAPDWIRKWKRFSQALNPEPWPLGADPDDVEDWIQTAVSKFARSHDLVAKFQTAIREGR